MAFSSEKFSCMISLVISFPVIVSLFLFHFTSVTQSYSMLCNRMDCSTPGFTVITTSQSLLTFVSIESLMLSNHFILCHPLLFLPSIFPSLWIRWPKFWSFIYSISTSNEYSGLISFRKVILNSLLLHHKNISSSALSLLLLHGPALTSVHDC